jgi:exopolysaccharide biosynthesis polyprenyl glycosylphosphotransferase
VVAVLAASIGHWIGLGNSAAHRSHAVLLAVTTVPGFVGSMVACRAWEPRILGSGSEEFSRLLRGVVSWSVVLGLVGLAFRFEATRPWVFGVLPAVGVLAGLVRLALRRQLHRRRANGDCLLRVLAVGAKGPVVDLIARTRHAPYHGWKVGGVCTSVGGRRGSLDQISGVPIVGDLDSVTSVVLRGGYEVVAVAPADGWSVRRLHRLSWDLEGSGIELVVHPGLVEITGPRLHVAPVDGLPLLRLTEPHFTGFPRLVKATVDRIGAALLLVVLAPLLFVLYVAVRADRGPAFFRQAHVGLRGREFAMLRFRSVAVGPETQPVTQLGALLRKYSLDELPQLVNVLRGSMSLVGPRPPLPGEVAEHSRDAPRRLVVKPGVTGLWPISGRVELSWEESVRLDLRYVQNWSLALDALILWKTVKAVICHDGAH